MEEDYGRTFSEVVEILENSEESVLNKISEKFMNFLYTNMDRSYKANIDFSQSNWEEFVREDTRTMMALIYRDYLVSEEERQVMLEEEKAGIQAKYSEDIFGRKNIEEQKQEIKEEQNDVSNIEVAEIKEENNNANSTEMMEIKEESWYKKIIQKILNFFKKSK